jgi:hypothetical protein
LLLARHVGVDREAFPLCLHGWGPPSPLAWVGDVILPYLRSIAVLSTVVLLLHETGGLSIWKGASPPPFTPEDRVADVFPPQPSPLASEAWIYDMEVTSYVYVFTPDYATAQQSWHKGGHQLWPASLAMGLRQFSALFKA